MDGAGKDPCETWGDAIAPLARKLRVAAALPGFDARWNSVGAKAFLQILEAMAHKLDVVAPARIAELEKERDAALTRLAEVEAELARERGRGGLKRLLIFGGRCLKRSRRLGWSKLCEKREGSSCQPTGPSGLNTSSRTGRGQTSQTVRLTRTNVSVWSGQPLAQRDV